MTKKLLLEELVLVCDREKKAKRVRFHPKVTVIRGPNKVGKSSLIKSIYRCLGASTWSDQSWDGLQIDALLRFRIDANRYSILHYGKHYSVFDSRDQLISNFNSVTRGLGPFIASLTDFKIQLQNQENETVTPPPAYLFLPFYVDQDKSWQENWNSFDRLRQMKGWRSDLINYHVGIKPNHFYEAKGDKTKLELESNELRSQWDSLRAIRLKLEEKLESAEFSFDIEEYTRQVTELLVEANKLGKIENSLKEQLVEHYNSLASIQAQLHITKSAANELKDDYQFATRDPHSDVTCPTCGASYDNSFAEKFDIAKDEGRCRELMIELEDNLGSKVREIEATEREFHLKQLEKEQIQEILNRKQGDLRVQDIIENQGREHIRKVIGNELDVVHRKMTELALMIKDAASRMRSFEDKARKREITDYYLEMMRKFLLILNVKELDSIEHSKIDYRFRLQGSSWPRALLAYYYSVLHVMAKYSSSTFCPIVIDAPHQQDPDDSNLQKILLFIREQQPTDSQLVLGVVSDHGVLFEGEYVELTNPYSMLEAAEYSHLSQLVKGLLDQTIGA